MGCAPSVARGCCGPSDDVDDPQRASKYAAKPRNVPGTAFGDPNEGPDARHHDDASGSSGDSHLPAVVLEVAGELDPAIRRALAPVLSKGRARTLGDEYDETDAKQLGKGAFSVVYAVRHRKTGTRYAAKVVKMRGMTEDQRRNTIRALMCEAGVSAVIRHPTIVGFHDLIFEESRCVLVQEYCRGGTLLSTVQHQVDKKRHERRAAAAAARERVFDGHDESFAGGGGRDGNRTRDGRDDEGDRAGAAASARVASAVGGGLPEGDAIVALRRLAEALAHLHERGFVHRDVKLENLLLGSPGDLRTLKLADFGFATAASDRDGCRSRAFLAKDLTGDRLQGTVEYAAPEVLADIGMTAPGKNGELGMLTDDRGARLRPNPDRLSNTRPEVDLWSAGVTAFIALGGYHLFDASKESMGLRGRMDVTLQREYEKPVWSNISPEAKRVIQALLRSEPRDRLTAEQLLADRWLAAEEVAETNPPMSPRMSPRISPRLSPGMSPRMSKLNGKMANGGSPGGREAPARVSPRRVPRADDAAGRLSSTEDSEYV